MDQLPQVRVGFPVGSHGQADGIVLFLCPPQEKDRPVCAWPSGKLKGEKGNGQAESCGVERGLGVQEAGPARAEHLEGFRIDCTLFLYGHVAGIQGDVQNHSLMLRQSGKRGTLL